MPMFWHWFLHFTGSDNVSGPWYGFWSGFGSDLTLFTGAGIFLRHKNCRIKGCWRLGHPDPEHGHPVCKIHQTKL